MAVNFGGILAGALGGAGAAIQGQAQGQIADERKLNLEQQLSAMEEERQMRIAEANEQRRRSGSAYDFGQKVANAPQETQMTVDRAGALAKGATQAQLDADAAYGQNPEARAGVRAKAQDQHIESSGSAAEGELKRMALENEKKRQALLSRREDIVAGNLRGDQRARALEQVDQQLTALDIARNGKKNEDINTDQVERRDYVYGNENAPDKPTRETITKSTERHKASPFGPKKPAAEESKGGKTATRAEVTAYAAARGLKYEDAVKGLTTGGYRVVD
jgi:hypothetical protein